MAATRRGRSDRRNQTVRRVLDHFPRLKALLRSVYYCRSPRIPPVSKNEISREIIRECVGKEDPTILEIGCNDGTHTLWFLEIFRTPRVYCFEPDPRAITRFRKNVGQRPNIQLFKIALSDHNGEVEFYQSDGRLNKDQPQGMSRGWDASGSIRRPKEHLVVYPWVTFKGKVTVATSTLDAWSENYGIGAVDLIWMDVQGAEIDVFRGGKQTLAKTRFIYTEYDDRELYEGQFNLKQLIRYLKRFDVVVRYPTDVLLLNKRRVGVRNKPQQGMLVNSRW